MAVKCTYKTCQLSFQTVEKMQAHKRDAKDHYYCDKCDIDFDKDVRFLIHQIQSSRHICCPIDGLEFKSVAGRDLHVERCHPAKQHLPCAGCGKVFDRAAYLMSHIERGECKVISHEDFQRQRVERHIEKSFEDSIFDPIDGLPPVPPTDLSTCNTSQTSLNTFQSHTPVKMQEDLIDLREPEAQIRSPENDMDSVISWQTNNAYGSTSSTPTMLEKASSMTQITSFSTTMNVDKYLNPARNKYTCPMVGCKRDFSTAERFTEHLMSGIHAPAQIPCPSCYKLFRTTTALIAHCESASRKCNIRYSINYNQVLREVTGGILGTEGHHEDGSIRYTAPTVERW